MQVWVVILGTDYEGGDVQCVLAQRPQLAPLVEAYPPTLSDTWTVESDSPTRLRLTSGCDYLLVQQMRVLPSVPKRTL